MPVRRLLSTFLVAAAAVAVIAPAAAGAATTVGSTFNPAGSSCSTNNLLLQTASPSNLYAVPSDGVLTSWSSQASANEVPNVKLKVARPTANPDEFFVVAESAVKAPVANTTNTYTDISIPVQAGDFLGMRLSSPGNCGNLAGGAGYVSRYSEADPAPNTTIAIPALATDDIKIDISATLEPDCDEDGLGDETEDADLSACTPTADAGPDQEVASGASVSLDGSGSTDPEGDTLSYEWEQTAGPSVALSGPDTAKPNFTAPTGPASPTFELKVCDPTPLCDVDSVVIAVKSPPSQPPGNLPPATNQLPLGTNAAPNTSLKSTKIVKQNVTFKFGSNEGGSTFLCKLDKKAFAKCKSPTTYRNLKPGKHKFQVKARDAQGALDPSPAVKRFTISSSLPD